jgi:hypothetical protein
MVAEDNEMCKRILAKQLGGLGVVDLHVVDNGLEARQHTLVPCFSLI